MRKAASIVALAAVGVMGFAAAPVHAAPVKQASLAFSGDPDDYISGGRSYSYATANQDQISVNGSEDRGHIGVSVNGANGDWWSLDLAAPRGAQLAAGTYAGAQRYPFQAATSPGLDLSGNGRGCNTLTGSFAIQSLVWGPNGYVESLDATYVQHCEGGTAALRGEVHVRNEEPPAELSLDLDVSVTGTASSLNGKATINGAVACNVPVRVTVTGLVTQVKRGVLIRGPYSTAVDCTPGQDIPWTATADPTGTTPFQRGKVEVGTTASAIDPEYHKTVSVSATTVVTLKKV